MEVKWVKVKDMEGKDEEEEERLLPVSGILMGGVPLKTTSENGKAIGYLYKLDCKPIVTETSLPSGWSTVAFEHQKGYVLRDPQTKIEVCQEEVVYRHITDVTTSTTQLPTTPQPTTTTTRPTTTTTKLTTTTKPTTPGI
ncbi:uncharacterized protein LOC132724196 [Ruditapes philippinarum]|uniref:uncharacterized protein LOC132724196 n=1 Tax=Ruditapes philippinarum TaxID=129788 RepID=UPI00295B6307|nr:uncharacterized protein LOC132724196 [Ruditapes philippinarum]